MVIAVGDIGSTIIWTASSAQMQSAAERAVHFVQGGQWREEFVGTNALALSLKLNNQAVFSMNIIWSRFTIGFVMRHHIDPYSKQTLGVVDLSTTWKNHNTLGILAAEFVPPLFNLLC